MDRLRNMALIQISLSRGNPAVRLNPAWEERLDAVEEARTVEQFRQAIGRDEVEGARIAALLSELREFTQTTDSHGLPRLIIPGFASLLRRTFLPGDALFREQLNRPTSVPYATYWTSCVVAVASYLAATVAGRGRLDAASMLTPVQLLYAEAKQKNPSLGVIHEILPTPSEFSWGLGEELYKPLCVDVIESLSPRSLEVFSFCWIAATVIEAVGASLSTLDGEFRARSEIFNAVAAHFALDSVDDVINGIYQVLDSRRERALEDGDSDAAVRLSRTVDLLQLP